MIKHIWSIVCQQGIIDQGTNNVSLINILEEIEVQVGPKISLPPSKLIMVPINYQIVTLWENPDQEKVTVDVCVRVQSPDDKVVGEFISPINIPASKQRMRGIIKINSLPVQDAGQYKFEIGMRQQNAKLDTKKFEIVAQIPLEVKLKQVTIDLLNKP